MGELAALRGYRWQYDHIAALVYDSLVDGDFVALRLADPNAGQVDDLVLIRRGRTDGYQFRSVELNGYLTFREVEKKQRTRGRKEAPSLLRSLADGWSSLKSRWGSANVHLVTNRLASVRDHLGCTGDADKPSPDHFSAFLSRVLKPLHSGEITLEDVGVGWRCALNRLRQASGVPPEEFESFLQSLHFDVGAGSGLSSSSSLRKTDITTLSTALWRRVSEAHAVVKLDRVDVLELTGWQDRPRLHSHHEFPVDLHTYEPLTVAVEELKALIAGHDSGYLAVVGPPGAGKSTLLSQALTGSADRIARYYAYVPGAAQARRRLTAHGFLHDLVVMLSEIGVGAGRRELVSDDVPQLRRQLADLLDAAGQEFGRTGRRTIVVVDGLDHVARDYPGTDGLLGELPQPRELPKGVLFIVGSRSLEPVHAYVRQHLGERRAVIDLQDHPLTKASVLKICRRAPVTVHLGSDAHSQIAELCNGHPLTLSYLLNRLRDAPDEAAEDVLAGAPSFGGDVEAEYLALWDEVERDDGVVDILTVCSRLRIAFPIEWLSLWAPRSAVRTFTSHLSYLFHHGHDGWRFFHDSFRQFASVRTALGDDVDPNAVVDAQAHQRIADLCAQTDKPRIAAEQVYHRYQAGQYAEVLSLAGQSKFREQYTQLRSPHLIREDIALALAAAADRADVLAMLRLLLALVEVNERSAALEYVDMPGLLHSTGLTEDAIAYCGTETREVPLAQAYGLAARLGSANDARGRQMFDLIEHDGLDDPERMHVSGEQDKHAVAWTRAAFLFRPLSAVIDTVATLLESHPQNDRRDRYEQSERWQRYERMMRGLVDAAVLRKADSALITIDTALADHVSQLVGDAAEAEGSDDGTGSGRDRHDCITATTGLRVRLRSALVGFATTTEARDAHLRKLHSILQGASLSPWSVLDAAELFARYGMAEQAAELLEQTPYGTSLTVDALRYNDDAAALGDRFRYWRLRHLLALDADAPAAAPPGADTPTGDAVEAIELFERIDTAIRTLSWVDAAITRGKTVSGTDVWAALVPLLDLVERLPKRSSVTLLGIKQQKPEVARLIATVALSYGDSLPQRLSDDLARRFREQPEEWPLPLRLDVAEQLRSAGTYTPWFRETLTAMEVYAASRDVTERLDIVADLAGRCARDGDEDAARRLVRTLTPIAFGVGYRKDRQFDSWVAWLGRAIAGPEGHRYVEEAQWLARLLRAVEPMTEGAPRSAAADLPAAIVCADPVAAVRVFEYFVRQGTVHHPNALAALVRALVARAGPGELKTVELAADIAGELLAPAANRAYPELAAALVEAAEGAADHGAATALAESVARCTDSRALPTARAEWRQGLGLPVPIGEHEGKESARASADDFEALVQSDGQSITAPDVRSRIQSAADVFPLRSSEASDSTFPWVPVIEQLTLTNEDVRTLADAFSDGSRRSAEVIASLAETAELNGDLDLARSLAADAFQHASSDSWSQYFGGARLRAAGVNVRLKGGEALKAACQDLARQATSSRWFPGLLHADLEAIVEALDPNLDAGKVWSEVRTYLDGMADELDLTRVDSLADHGCRWWLLEPTGDRRAAAEESSPAVALAELAVGHLSHPTWLIRDAATTTVTRALLTDNEEVAQALVRFLQPDASDDILERVGRCLAAARSHEGYTPPATLQPLERLLADHPSQVVRDLAVGRMAALYRPLPPTYHLTLPAGATETLDSEPCLLWPYESIYELLADHLGLGLDTLLRVAARYALEEFARLPQQDAVLSSLKASQVRHVYAPEGLAASRAAFGRVLADLGDAGLLDGAPPQVRRLLRTVDIELLSQAPQTRPSLVPPPPAAGHDQTIARWFTEIDSRLEEYVRASEDQGRLVIGARSRLAVLNRGHLSEKLLCGTTLGATRPDEDMFFGARRSALLRDLVTAPAGGPPTSGEPLTVENIGETFHQFHANWLAFRPDLAGTLGWKPDRSLPGWWYTAIGDPAVETVWWVDGWWGRAGPAFDDTEADGYAVVLTQLGLTEVTTMFGELSRHFALTRSGRHDDGASPPPLTASQHLPIVVRPA